MTSMNNCRSNLPGDPNQPKQSLLQQALGRSPPKPAGQSQLPGPPPVKSDGATRGQSSVVTPSGSQTHIVTPEIHHYPVHPPQAQSPPPPAKPARLKDLDPKHQKSLDNDPNVHNQTAAELLPPSRIHQPLQQTAREHVQSRTAQIKDPKQYYPTGRFTVNCSL